MLELFIKRVENQRKIALVEDGKIIEYYEEGDNDNKNEGNIYIGVVKDIVKGMQAAFVDIGTEKNSMIHLKVDAYCGLPILLDLLVFFQYMF